MPHHYGHAYHAAVQPPFDQAVCLTVDGSGDQHTAVLWRKDGDALEALREIFVPHSLGWFYAAITEYLGFAAYDGEYKVMGLAAYGRPDAELRAKLGGVVGEVPDGVEFRVDPRYLYYGLHTWSGRFTDELVELLGRPPRRPDDELTSWHEDLAYAPHDALEEAVSRPCSGVCADRHRPGVYRGRRRPQRQDQQPPVRAPRGRRPVRQPLCSDSGAAIGAALAACQEQTGSRPEPLRTLALGPSDTEDDIERGASPGPARLGTAW